MLTDQILERPKSPIVVVHPSLFWNQDGFQHLNMEAINALKRDVLPLLKVRLVPCWWDVASEEAKNWPAFLTSLMDIGFPLREIFLLHPAPTEDSDYLESNNLLTLLPVSFRSVVDQADFVWGDSLLQNEALRFIPNHKRLIGKGENLIMALQVFASSMEPDFAGGVRKFFDWLETEIG